MSSDAQVEAAIRGFGFVRDRGGDVTEAIRAALAAAQAAAPNVDFVKISLAISSALAWQPSEKGTSYREQRDNVEALIREALRPHAAPAESEVMQHHEGHQRDAHSDSLHKTLALSASEPAGPSEEDVARAALTQIIAVCDDNMSLDNNATAMALRFVRDVAVKARG